MTTKKAALQKLTLTWKHEYLKTAYDLKAENEKYSKMTKDVKTLKEHLEEFNKLDEEGKKSEDMKALEKETK